MSRRITVTAVAAAAVFTTGCFDIPPYSPTIKVTYDADGDGGATAAGHGFSLHFAGDPNKFHFPDSLTIAPDLQMQKASDQIELLGNSQAQGCHDENEAGILIAPTPRISADGTAMPVTNQLVPVLRGPAVVQVRLEWSTALVCTGQDTRTPTGTSTFTVYPDGRIVRYDTLVDPGPSPISAGNCSCDSQANEFRVFSYWTLAKQRFQNLFAPDYSPDKLALPVFTDPEITNIASACLTAGQYQLAFAWNQMPPAGGYSNQTGIHGNDALIGFGRYMRDSTSMLESFSWTTSSAIFIERGNNDCMAALARANEQATPSPLMIKDGDNAVMMPPSALDGIYGGADGNGQTGIALRTDQVELTGPVNSSFAVWLRFPHAVDAVRATLPGMTGAWYVPQQVDDHSWIVWFQGRLSAGQTITIHPN